MSAAFTIGYSDHQSHGVYEELRKAYNERRTALGQGLRYWDASVCEWDDVVEEDIAVAVGDRIQNHKFFREIQLWIIENCGYFLDPSVSDYSGEAYIKNISELNTAQSVPYDTAFEYFCREIVGGNLVSSEETPVYEGFGFREWYDEKAVLRISGADFGQMIRCGSDIGESYDTGHARGKVIAKLVGETTWCVTDDICTCLSALRATKITGTGTGGAIVPKANSGLERYGEDFLGLDPPGDYTVYAADTPSQNSNYPEAAAWKTLYSNYDKRLNNSCTVDYVVQTGASGLIHSAKLYYKTKMTTRGEDGGYEFDNHTTGCVASAYGTIANLSFATDGTVESQRLLNLAGSAFTLYNGVYGGSNYPYSKARGFERYGGASDFTGVALWNFTNGIAWA